MAAWTLLSIIAVLLVAFWYRSSRRSRRRAEATSWAATRIPEIRALVESCDPAGLSDGEPLGKSFDEASCEFLRRSFAPDTSFAVQNFFACVENYRAAREELQHAFRPGSDLPLGDQIRAKDRRDSCLKNVYLTGEAAIQKLAATIQGRSTVDCRLEPEEK